MATGTVELGTPLTDDAQKISAAGLRAEGVADEAQAASTAAAGGASVSAEVASASTEVAQAARSDACSLSIAS